MNLADDPPVQHYCSFGEEAHVKVAVLVVAIALTAICATYPVWIEVLRRIVHNRRERREGIGGTQDIAMWGTFSVFGCFLLAALFWITYYTVK
jgi:hypothetical protein